MLKHQAKWRAYGGFTLTELLISLTILAVLVGIAAPNFRDTIVKYRLRTAAEGFVNGLQLARTEAVRRNTEISFGLNAGAGWVVSVTTGGATIQSSPAKEIDSSLTVTTNNNNSALTFNPMGAVKDFSNAATLKQLTVSHSSSNDSYQIDIFAGGAMRMCDPNVTADKDPRKC